MVVVGAIANAVAQIFRPGRTCRTKCLLERAGRGVATECADAGCRCTGSSELWSFGQGMATRIGTQESREVS